MLYVNNISIKLRGGRIVKCIKHLEMEEDEKELFSVTSWNFSVREWWEVLAELHDLKARLGVRKAAKFGSKLKEEENRSLRS